MNAADPIDVIEEGDVNEICRSEQHPSNAFSPIVLTEDGIVMSESLIHPLKAYDPIEVIEEGLLNVICLSEKHPSNAFSPIDVTEDVIVNSLSFAHDLKQFLTISIPWWFNKILLISMLFFSTARRNKDK